MVRIISSASPHQNQIKKTKYTPLVGVSELDIVLIASFVVKGPYL